MLSSHDTRSFSLEAKRQRVAAHGWNVSALPLTATVAERLRAKAEADDEMGDRADEVLAMVGG
jgi:hypothetical protein